MNVIPDVCPAGGASATFKAKEKVTEDGDAVIGLATSTLLYTTLGGSAVDEAMAVW